MKKKPNGNKPIRGAGSCGPGGGDGALASDGSPFKALDRRIEFLGTDAIDTAVLETFDYQFPGREIDIITATEEFTSVCPFSGLPDFGKLTISYVPGKKCVELRSLKYYLLSFRNVGMFYEHLANRIMADLIKILDPVRIEVTAVMTPRGGLSTTIRASHEKKRKNRKSPRHA